MGRAYNEREQGFCLCHHWDCEVLTIGIKRKAPIVEYRLIGGKFVRNEIEDGFQLILTFDRGDGNQEEYKNRNSNE